MCTTSILRKLQSSEETNSKVYINGEILCVYRYEDSILLSVDLTQSQAKYQLVILWILTNWCDKSMLDPE